MRFISRPHPKQIHRLVSHFAEGPAPLNSAETLEMMELLAPQVLCFCFTGTNVSNMFDLFRGGKRVLSQSRLDTLHVTARTSVFSPGSNVK